MSVLEIVDIDALEWSSSPSGVKTKLLREDPVSGARSVIAKAPPRAPGASRPHRHTADEEVFNLGPPMRFDKGPWLNRFGYVKYPASMVHGGAVTLPEGYLLYLRMSGRSQLEFVEGAETVIEDGYVFSPHAKEAPWVAGTAADLPDAYSVYLLSYSSQDQIGTLLVKVPQGGAIKFPKTRRTELLILGGQLKTCGATSLVPNTFVYADRNEAQELISATDALIFMHFSNGF